MSTFVDSRYITYYIPLVQEFCREVEVHGLDLPDGLPQPFLPLYGEGYKHSSLRIAIVGQDTYGWGCLKGFLKNVKASPDNTLATELAEYRERYSTDWGGSPYTFEGFVMKFLAATHDCSDWGVMSQSARNEILSSFIWGNVNAIEYFNSSEKNVSREQWKLIRTAGERFDRLGHLIEALHPHVVIVLSKDMDPETYCANYDYVTVEERDGVGHFRIPDEQVDILHVPHPVGMRWEGGPRADHYCTQLIARLRECKLTVSFPAFIQQNEDSNNVIAYLRNSAPIRGDKFDKFQFVEWVAEELKKRESFMSVSTLAQLLNDLGYRTNYGSKYKGARGTYKLISGTYQRLDREGKENRALMIAETFRKPDFDYAYTA